MFAQTTRIHIRPVIRPSAQRGPQTPSVPGLGGSLLKLLGVVTGCVVVYKGLQAIFDEDFGGGEFPQAFREELRQQHIAQHGSRCPQCSKRVRYGDLTVDHIVSMKNGGRTSRANAEVLCRPCNSQKGARNNMIDHIRGRSY